MGDVLFSTTFFTFIKHRLVYELNKERLKQNVKANRDKKCIAWGNVNEGAELVRVCNATTMIDVVRLVTVPEFPINLQSLGSVIFTVYLWCCNANL